MKIIECPRDAMQGITSFIPTDKKVAYLNALLQVGFDTLDFGSFVSPKAIPQMRDTAEVLSRLEPSSTALLAIVANLRGADAACQHQSIKYVGYPFSVSETFQKRNTNKSIDESLILVDSIQNTCAKHDKTLVVYLSMAFGNPYGEIWHEDHVTKWGEKLSQLGVEIIALSDTTGVSSPPSIRRLFTQLMSEINQVEWGAHLHTTPESWREKLEAAYDSGCRRFDGAVNGLGGCPMAHDELVGNMPTEKLLTFCQEKQLSNKINNLAFESAYNMAVKTFRGL